MKRTRILQTHTAISIARSAVSRNAHCHGHRMIHTFLVGFCALFLFMVTPADADMPSPSKDSHISPHRVLVLNSYHHNYRWGDAVMRGISEVFQQRAPEVEVRYEYLDAKHYRPNLVFGPMRELLLAKYEKTGFYFDVIIATDDDALDFLALYRDEIFPGTPVVFCGTNTFDPSRLKGKTGFTGIVEDYDLKGTLDLALRLHPDTRHWALVSGMSTSSLMNQKRFYDLLPQYKGRIHAIDLSRLNVDEMIEQLQKLPNETVIIYLSWYKMPDGTFLSVRESTSLVLEYGNRPMYSPWDYTMGYGVIGGHVLKASQHGSQAADVALEILAGKTVTDIPVIRHSYFSYLFDYQMLERFGISKKSIPASHAFINEPDTLYYKYKKQIWVIAGVFFYLLATILALLRVISQRKAVEANLRLNESRLEALLELNQSGKISLPGINRMVLGKAVELTKSKLGFLVLLEADVPRGQACTVNEKGAMEFHTPDGDTLIELGKTEAFKMLTASSNPALIDAPEELYILKAHLFPDKKAVLHHFAILPVMSGKILRAVVGVGNKRSSYDETDSRQLRLLVEGMLALIRNRRAKKREKRLQAQLQQAQKMEAIGTFAGGIAHDFNNILGGISSCCELAMSELPENKVIREDLQHVLKAANRGKSLVRQILSFSRKKAERIDPTDLKQVFTETMSLVRSLMPETIEIQANIPGEQVMVMADPTQIQQVILNLCANAEQTMRGRHGLLEIGLETTRIEAGGEAEVNTELSAGEYATIYVTDTGEGIPRERLQRIFEPFYTTRSFMGGTGLGLSTSHGIIRRHGGTIRVKSTPGRGSTFWIHLPMVDRQGTPVKNEPAGIINGGSERILLVDDNEIMRYSLTKYLRQLGYSVRACENGKDAFAAFRETAHPYQLVVTDQSMPLMTGMELVQQIRKIDPTIPVILISGFQCRSMTQPDPSKPENMQVQRLLSKPFANEELGSTVREILDNAAPTQP